MMQIGYGRNFLSSVKRLPKNVQIKLDQLLSVVAVNPYDHRLHTKKLHGHFIGCLSFRITRDWRVMFQFTSPNHLILLTAQHRRDIYR